MNEQGTFIQRVANLFLLLALVIETKGRRIVVFQIVVVFVRLSEGSGCFSCVISMCD